LKRYDSDLYADKATDGKVDIYRKCRTYELYNYEGKNLYVSTIKPQWVFALTQDWSMSGYPVDWGIEPILTKLKRMDQWRKEDALTRVRAHNEMIERNKERAFRNDVRARAADLRQDFAKVTNDIRTANMNKVSNRRKKDGHCK